jgi:predicted esterase
MNRSAEGARRIVRRVIVTICALITVGLLSVALIRGAPGARAEGSVQETRGIAGGTANKINNTDNNTKTQVPPSAPLLPLGRETRRTGSGTEVIVYPPVNSTGAAATRAPVVMMLHGMCGDPLSICDFWNQAGREGSWLVCPGGNVACGDARDWSGSGEVKAAAIDESLAAIDKAYGSFIDHGQGDILIGYSRGAFVARDVAYARPGRFRGLILLGALMRPDAARLKASGVRRVVLAAGEWDMARPAMQRSAAALTSAGLPSRYVSLGKIGHALPDNLEAILRDAIRWIRAAPSEPG